MIRALVFSCVVVLATAAPVQLDEQPAADTPLVRTKRSEEAILFGNHQNFARVKKGDPHPHPFNGLADDNDEAPETDKASDNEGMSEDNTEEEAVHKSTKEDEEEQIEKLLTSEAEVDPLTASQDKAEEERILEHLLEEQEHPGSTGPQVPSEGLPIAHPDRVLEGQGPTLEEEEEEASGEIKDAMDDDDARQYDSQYESQRGLLFPQTMFKSFREKRSLAHDASTNEEVQVAPVVRSRESRSIAKVAPATAEDMMSSARSAANGRVKRDLNVSPEELQELIENEYYGNNEVDPEMDNDVYYEPEEREYYPESPGVYDEEEPPMERRAESYMGDAPYGYNGEGPVLDIDPRSFENAMFLPEDEELADDNKIDPEEQRKLELLDYLYSTQQEAAGPPSPYEEAEEEDDGGPGYPGDFEETWHDLGPAKEVQYEPEQPYYAEDSDQDQGYEMKPSKRQYLSFVPGNKRGSDFYPYQYGPDGRWGAMVADSEREKRNELSEYERLYELAQALNGPQERSYEKRFDYGGPYDRMTVERRGGEPAYFQDYDVRRRK